MGLIIIGVIVAALLIWIKNRPNLDIDYEEPCGWLAAIVFSFGVTLGLMLPGTPYEMTYCTPILSLSDGMYVSGRMSGGICPYVYINTDNSYSYYYEINSEYKAANTERSYKQGIVSGDVTVIEYDSTSNETPALYVYEFGTRSNFWTFDLSDNKKYKRVFRVPKGTVVQQFELNGM